MVAFCASNMRSPNKLSSQSTNSLTTQAAMAPTTGAAMPANGRLPSITETKMMLTTYSSTLSQSSVSASPKPPPPFSASATIAAKLSYPQDTGEAR